MRIGQLARKLDISPSQIINYLEGLGIEMDKGVNTKLVQAGIEKVMDEFGQIEMEDAITAKVEVNEIEVPETLEKEAVVEPDKEVKEEEELTIDNSDNEKKITSESDTVAPESIEEVDDTEIIRPDYVKLQGLKVVDKIDLPTPKPKVVETPKEETEVKVEPVETEIKEEKQEEEESYIITEEQIKADLQRHYNEQRLKEKKQRTPRPKPRAERKKKTQLTYEQKLEKEKQQAEKNKVAQEKKQKELKKKKYATRMKNVQPPKVKKTKPNKKEEPSFPVKEKYKKTPTSAWGKFMKWLNT